MQGTILKAISGFYYVNTNNKTYECKARGNFRKAGISPVVGDRVDFTIIDNEHGVVEKIHERKNFLSRPLIANLDKLFIVSSYKTPSPDFLSIDRLTAVAVYHNIEPIIVFNKCDMGDFGQFKKVYLNTCFKTYFVSAKDDIGMQSIKNELKDSVCAFAGNSGVGKSSIINSVFNDFSLKTGEVSEKLGRGRHTTRHTELYQHNLGGYVADTPGFSSFEVDLSDYNFKLNLANCFPEFSDHLSMCKFSSCSHTIEKGCAIIDAVNDSKIEKSRHNSYTSIYNELKNLNVWNSSIKK